MQRPHPVAGGKALQQLRLAFTANQICHEQAQDFQGQVAGVHAMLWILHVLHVPLQYQWSVYMQMYENTHGVPMPMVMKAGLGFELKKESYLLRKNIDKQDLSIYRSLCNIAG